MQESCHPPARRQHRGLPGGAAGAIERLELITFSASTARPQMPAYGATSCASSFSLIILLLLSKWWSSLGLLSSWLLVLIRILLFNWFFIIPVIIILFVIIGLVCVISDWTLDRLSFRSLIFITVILIFIPQVIYFSISSCWIINDDF